MLFGSPVQNFTMTIWRMARVGTCWTAPPGQPRGWCLEQRPWSRQGLLELEGKTPFVTLEELGRAAVPRQHTAERLQAESLSGCACA